MERIFKDAFCVIGKAGSTNDGDGFVKRLWDDADSHFEEVSDLAAKNDDGSLKGFWGAMTNFAFEFKPWEKNFTEGMYLAGVEVNVDAAAPKGWKKWIIPGFEYIKVEVQGPDTFPETITYLNENNIPLAGAVQDLTDPKTGIKYMMFPIACNDSKQKMIQLAKAETDQFAVCGFHCEYCFLAEWCGGCRSTCNMCSYAAVNYDNVCPNVSCCKEKGYDGCYECDGIRECKIGFYAPGSDGANASKALAITRRKYGGEAVKTALKSLHEEYDFAKLQEVLDENLEKAVLQLQMIIQKKDGTKEQ